MLTIVIVIFAFILLMLLIMTLTNTSSNIQDATNEQKLSWDDVNGSGTANSNYTYYIWINVQDWNYKFGEEKIIFTQGGGPNLSAKPNFRMSLNANQNNVKFNLKTTSQNHSQSYCEVVNIPLQTWVCFLMSVYGKYMDVYVDGKLVKTCILNNVCSFDETLTDQNVYITPGGGFDGYVSSFKYLAKATNPQEAYNIYSGGYSGNIVSNILNKFRIKFTFLVDNKDSGSFEI